jgi:hypothetical protein
MTAGASGAPCRVARPGAAQDCSAHPRAVLKAEAEAVVWRLDQLQPGAALLQPPRVLAAVQDDGALIHTHVPQQAAAVDKRGGLQLERTVAGRGNCARAAGAPGTAARAAGAGAASACLPAVWKARAAQCLDGM